MVGYDKNDTMTVNQKFIAGCVSGAMTRFITQPLDVVKLRTQVQKQPKGKKRNMGSWFHTTRNIMKKEGITAFWRGHNIGQVHSVSSVSTQFFVYEMGTKYVANTSVSDKQKGVLVFFCGIFAGCCSATFASPLEVIRVRQMLIKNQYKGFINGAREVYSTGGFIAFFEGLTPSVLMMGPQIGIAFSVFQFVQPRILNYFHKCEPGVCVHAPGNAHRPEYLLIASSTAGCISGLVSKTVTYPMDLVKRRMQIGSHKPAATSVTTGASQKLIQCKKLTECLTRTYKKEGFFGFYRGWQVTIYKAQLTNIVAFTTYELMSYGFREFSHN